MRLTGGRTGKRAVIAEQLELDGLTYPFDLELWYGDRVAVLGANGTGKSHFLRLLARGGTDPDPANIPVDGAKLAPVTHDGVVRLGAAARVGCLTAAGKKEAAAEYRGFLEGLRPATRRASSGAGAGAASYEVIRPRA